MDTCFHLCHLMDLYRRFSGKHPSVESLEHKLYMVSGFVFLLENFFIEIQLAYKLYAVILFYKVTLLSAVVTHFTPFPTALLIPGDVQLSTFCHTVKSYLTVNFILSLLIRETEQLSPSS